eukprot:5960280-Pyramimonas_sp.AAC.1
MLCTWSDGYQAEMPVTVARWEAAQPLQPKAKAKAKAKATIDHGENTFLKMRNQKIPAPGGEHLAYFDDGTIRVIYRTDTPKGKPTHKLLCIKDKEGQIMQVNVK